MKEESHCMLEGKNIIYIKKRSMTQWLTIFIATMPFFLQALMQFFHIPGLIKYTIDIAWIVVLATFLFKGRIQLKRGVAPFAVLIILFFCYCLIVYLFRFQSPFYFLWGIRNNFRGYIAFLAVAILLDYDDIKTLFKLIDVLFVVNFFVAIYQALVLGYVQDFCGGIFGVETGSNASAIVLYCVVTARSLLLYMNGQEKTALCFGKCTISLVLSALAELKFFFVIFVIILITAAAFTRFSWKKTAFMVLVVFVMSISGAVMTALFESDLSLESVVHLITTDHYSSREDIGRLTAIPQISETILTRPPQRLFGLGLGNCDTSSFSICNTPFFQMHQGINYIWFSSACLFLETGLVGLILYLSFFVLCFFMAFRKIKQNTGDPFYSQMSMIMAVLCVAFTFYNSSLRTEIGYVAYFVLALPFIGFYKNRTH